MPRGVEYVGLWMSAVWIAGRSGNLYALGLVSLPLALLLWAAIRFSPMLTMLATIVVVVFLSLVTGLGLGGFTRPLTLLDSAVLMMLLIMIAAIPVMLCVSNHEKRSTAIALYRRATRDPLTGLLNRSTFEERARERLANGDEDLALLYLDLDHFKLVNDATSHVAGDDLIVDVPVTFSEAALGATVEVPTPDGPVSVKVKPGTQDGTLLRVKGKGAPKLKGSGRGDLLARVKVEVPKKLKKRERELLEELQKQSHDDPREALFS